MCKFFEKNKSQIELENNELKDCNLENVQNNIDNIKPKENKSSERKEKEEKEILKIGKTFIKMFRGIKYNKDFECVINNYKLPESPNEKDNPSSPKYLFIYKNTKVKVEFRDYSNSSCLNFFLVDSNKDELKILEIWYYDGCSYLGYCRAPSWDCHCLNERFENFSINVMQHIMTELKEEETKRIEYFESLIPAEDLE